MYVYEPFKIAENVKGVGLINSDIFFLKDNGDLLKCGLDYDSTNSEKIMSDVQYISGYGHILILKDNGDLFAYGDNSHGQLGIDTADFVNEPVQIEYNVKSISTGAYHSLVLKNDGTLYACGNNEYGQLGTYSYDNCSILAEITNNVKGIAAGGNHSLILKNDGSLYACGDNQYGQLGVNLPVVVSKIISG